MHELKVEEVAGVAARQNRNHTMCDDDDELGKLNQRECEFEFFLDFLDNRVGERCDEVESVHVDVGH